MNNGRCKKGEGIKSQFIYLNEAAAKTEIQLESKKGLFKGLEGLREITWYHVVPIAINLKGWSHLIECIFNPENYRIFIEQEFALHELGQSKEQVVNAQKNLQEAMDSSNATESDAVQNAQEQLNNALVDQAFKEMKVILGPEYTKLLPANFIDEIKIPKELPKNVTLIQHIGKQMVEDILNKIKDQNGKEDVIKAAEALVTKIQESNLNQIDNISISVHITTTCEKLTEVQYNVEDWQER